MPKNKGKGGKNRRRGKNENEESKRELIFKEDGQEYAQVTKMLGGGRCETFCFDGKERLAHIRGKMRKKVWVSIGDIVLVGMRDYQDEKADVIHKYSGDEARSLKACGELPESARINETALGLMEGPETDEDDVELDFEESYHHHNMTDQPSRAPVETCFIKVVHGNHTQTVGIYSGLPPLELSHLLTAVFQLEARHPHTTVVGLQDEQSGTVLPLSLACAAPHLLTRPAFRLLLTDSDIFYSLPPPPPPTTVQRSSSFPPGQQAFSPSSSQVVMPPLPPTSSSTTTMDGSPSKASTVKWTLGQERREEQQQPAGGGLEREISTGATGATTITTTTKALSPVSFSQAIPSQGGGGGKEKAWRQMLRFVDVLAEQGMLNGDDVVALREGILHDRRVLLSGYEVAEYHRSAELLAVLWKATARSLLTDRGRKLVIFAQEHILEVLDLLLQTERITADQHIHLQHMCLIQHPAIVGPYERFINSTNLEDFMATILSIADQAGTILQTEPKVEGEGQRGLAGVQVEPWSKSLPEVLERMEKAVILRPELTPLLLQLYHEGNDYINAAFELYQVDGNTQELLDTLLRILKVEVVRKGIIQGGSGLPQSFDQSDRGADEDDEEEDEIAVNNPWKGKVPHDLVLAILNAVKTDRLTTEEGAELCDSYGDGDPMVMAAWKVYQVENNTDDLVDTLQRIARIRKVENRTQMTAFNTLVNEERLLALTRKTILARCLDAMIEKGMVDLAGFRALVELLGQESDIVVAAIDAYLEDEDLNELLDTLRLIAVHATASTIPNEEDDMSSMVNNDGDTSKDGVMSSTGVADTGEEEEDDEEGQEEEVEGEDMSFASDRAVKCSAASAASFSSLVTSEDDRTVSSEMGCVEKEEMLQSLVALGALTDQEGQTLTDMVYTRNRQLGDLFNDYIASKDGRTFRSKLRILAAAGRREIKELDEADEDEGTGEKDDNSTLDGMEEDQMAQVEDSFVTLVRSMNASSLEVAALRLCLAKDDENLRSALELFRLNQDAEDLKDSLKRIARRTIDAINDEMPGREDEEVEEETDTGPSANAGDEALPAAGASNSIEGGHGGRPAGATEQIAGNEPPAGSSNPSPTRKRAVQDLESVLDDFVSKNLLGQADKDRLVELLCTESKPQVIGEAVQDYASKHKSLEELLSLMRGVLDKAQREVEVDN